MKKIIPIFCLVPFLFLSHIDAAETSFPKSKAAPSRLYLGGEIARLNINTKNIEQKITGKNYFKGLRFGYDIIKPNAPYFGFHALFMCNKATFQFDPTPESPYAHFEPKTHQGKSLFANSEFRIGQTFAGQESLSTLFFGLGSYFLRFPYGDLSKRRKSASYSELLGYITGGALISYAVSPSLDAGCHLKAFRIFYSQEILSWDDDYCSYKNCTSQETKKNRDKSWGYEFGIPLIWHSAKFLSFDLQFEPYHLQLNTKRGKTKGYGVRLTLGSRF